MDPVVESALISADATLVGVGGTAAVAIVGFRTSRLTNQATIDAARATADKTIEAARDTNKATTDAAHADVHRTLKTTREGQITDRFTRAIDQLGHRFRIGVDSGSSLMLERLKPPIVMARANSAQSGEERGAPWATFMRILVLGCQP